MSLAQGNNIPTRPRIEPGSPDPESDALTTRPVRPLTNSDRIFRTVDWNRNHNSKTKSRNTLPTALSDRQSYD